MPRDAHEEGSAVVVVEAVLCEEDTAGAELDLAVVVPVPHAVVASARISVAGRRYRWYRNYEVSFRYVAL